MPRRIGAHGILKDGDRYAAGIIQGAFGRVTVGPMARALVPHVHAEYNLLVRLEGPDPLFVSEKQPLPVSDGVTLAFNPWKPHRKEPGTRGPAQIMALLIGADWLARIGHGASAPAGAIFSSPLVPHTDDARRKARALADAVAGTHADADGRFETLVADYLRAVIDADSPTRREVSQPATDARIRRATKILRSRARENPDLTAVASEVGMSRSRFFEQFKLTIGASPQQYLDWVRMSHATEALVNSTEKLHALAHDLGFGELTHFTRFIRQHLGLSPGEFRRRAYQLRNAASDDDRD